MTNMPKPGNLSSLHVANIANQNGKKGSSGAKGAGTQSLDNVKLPMKKG